MWPGSWEHTLAAALLFTYQCQCYASMRLPCKNVSVTHPPNKLSIHVWYGGISNQISSTCSPETGNIRTLTSKNTVIFNFYKCTYHCYSKHCIPLIPTTPTGQLCLHTHSSLHTKLADPDLEIQGHAGGGSWQPDPDEDVPVHCREVGLDDLQRSLPNRTIL